MILYDLNKGHSDSHRQGYKPRLENRTKVSIAISCAIEINGSELSENANSPRVQTTLDNMCALH